MFVNNSLEKLKVLIRAFQAKHLGSKIEIKFEESIQGLDADYSTGIIFSLLKLDPDKPNPMVLAQSLLDYLSVNLDSDLKDSISNIFITAPGFLNIKFSQKFWHKSFQAILKLDLDQHIVLPPDSRRNIAFEYGDANSHKIPHIGHLSSYVRGQVIANFLKALGHQVYQFSYQGDIGLQVAKCLWGYLGKSAEEIARISQAELIDKANFLQECYFVGAVAYENPQYQGEIVEINNQVYKHINKLQIDPLIAEAYAITLEWSEAYRSSFEQQLNIVFQSHIYESEIQKRALEICQQALQSGKLVLDDGAIIYPARSIKKDWHNRVFITQKGNPTYEAKDLGLAEKLKQDLPTYSHYVLAGSEQTVYFSIVSDAAEKILAIPTSQFKFLPNGLVTLESGKMSSRENNIITAQDCMDKAREMAKEQLLDRNIPGELIDKIADQIMQSALYFGFVKSDYSNTSVFNFQQALDFSGNSGPYLQYTVVRIRSLLNKVVEAPDQDNFRLDNISSELLISLNIFLEKLPEYIRELALHKVALGLFELAKSYNRFYNDHNILKLDNKEFRNSYLLLSKCYENILVYGLRLLNISIPDKM